MEMSLGTAHTRKGVRSPRTTVRVYQGLGIEDEMTLSTSLIQIQRDGVNHHSV